MCEDRAYAEKMGVSLRVIRRFGGAKYLKRIPESSRNLLFKRLSLTQKSRGLTALGMTAQPPVPRCLRPRIAVWDLSAKRRFQVLLRERGLDA
jgi:hypothetical protein